MKHQYQRLNRSRWASWSLGAPGNADWK